MGFSFACLPLACGKDSVPSPFGPGAGGGGGEAGMQGNAGFKLNVDGGDEVDPTLGGPCEDDGQCDDEVECTADRCDLTLGRCRFEPDDTACANPIYCDGAERCDVREGCQKGEPVACSDDSTCTIDVCVEKTQSCRHDPRDADGDGDPTRNCGGGDCDDANALVSSATSEVCGNAHDDDCDGQSDEGDCTSPEYDSCGEPLLVSEPGYYDLDLTATALDYPNECATELDAYRDAVMVIAVPEGGPWDVDVTAKLDRGKLALGTAEVCGDLKSARCEPSFQAPQGASVARLLLGAVEAGQYPVYVASDAEDSVQVHVELREAEPHPGDTCDEAVALTAFGDPVLVRLPSYQQDFASQCQPVHGPDLGYETLTGEAFLSFELQQDSDVTITAAAHHDLGEPVLSLLEACQSELTCRRSQPARLFVRDLPAGAYQVAVAGTGPDDVSVRLETAPVSPSPPGEGCDDIQPLTPGVEQIVDLATYEDAVHPQCLPGAPDAAFGFELKAPRDVALVGRLSDGDEGAVSIASASCSANYSCSTGRGTQVAIEYALPAGSYPALIESARGNPVGLSWFERPAAAAFYVPFSDDCDAPVTVPEVGGLFLGNTVNAFADFSAGCDQGGQEEGGAPDQILKLTLSKARRVILDMNGSDYTTLLSVREGKFCPGAEVPLACAPAIQGSRSYLDLDLQAGDYFIQIDGFDGAQGEWRLDVFTAPL